MYRPLDSSNSTELCPVSTSTHVWHLQYSLSICVLGILFAHLSRHHVVQGEWAEPKIPVVASTAFLTYTLQEAVMVSISNEDLDSPGRRGAGTPGLAHNLATSMPVRDYLG